MCYSLCMKGERPLTSTESAQVTRRERESMREVMIIGHKQTYGFGLPKPAPKFKSLESCTATAEFVVTFNVEDDEVVSDSVVRDFINDTDIDISQMHIYAGVDNRFWLVTDTDQDFMKRWRAEIRTQDGMMGDF